MAPVLTSFRVVSSAILLFVAFWTAALSQQDRSAQTPAASQKDKAIAGPRGLKLVLADGTYQLVREYQRQDDRVRYYSVERGDWEELPASLVDWDATAKAAETNNKNSAALVAKVHKLEESKRMDNVGDIDASLPVGHGAFLPQGEGMFLVEGASIRVLDQVASDAKTDKARAIEQVLSPVHLIPGKKNLILAGAHATVRLKTKSPEFYLREAPPDPERRSQIQKSSRPGENGPDVQLIQTKVRHSSRLIESISAFFPGVTSEKVKTISLQRWEVAGDVYRFTLGEALPPGEYVLAEMLPGGINYYVWDFGVDEIQGTAGTK
ncbi:MAG: hypothetical protein M3N22_08465 [Acidobacteriota bacterium]|nr:hypothetical protein [Acidobacteriota bacterium]